MSPTPPPATFAPTAEPGAGTAPAAATPEAVLERCTRIVYAQAHPGVYVSPIVAGLLAWALWPEAEPALLLGWIVGIVAVSCARALLLYGFERAAAQGAPMAVWRHAYLAIAAANGAAWGIGAPLLAAHVSEHGQYVILVTISGIAVAAMATMGALLRVYLVFMVSTMAPFMTWLLLGGSETGLVFGAMVFVGIVGVTGAAQQYARNIQHSVRLALENNELLRRLDSTAGLARSATDGLEAETARRREVERHASVQEARNAATLASIGDAVVATDAVGSITAMNAAAEKMSGWTAAEALGFGFRSIFDLHDPGNFGTTPDPLQQCLRTQEPVRCAGTLQLVHRNDHEVSTVEASVIPVRLDDGPATGAVISLRDVTRLRALERRMAFQERHDPVTGLINRSELEQRLARAIATAAGDDMLLLLEVDAYKAAYFRGGPEAGAELLRRIAETLDGSLREADTLARVGIDDFAVLLRDCPPERAAVIGEELCAAVRALAAGADGPDGLPLAAVLHYGVVPVTGQPADAGKLLLAALAEARRMRDREAR